MDQTASHRSEHSALSGVTKHRGHLTFIWSVLGVTALLLQAQVRLFAIAWEALSSGTMSNAQLALCLFWVLINSYLEGYRGFHLKFVPRVIARAHHLAMTPGTYPAILGPIFAMAYVHASKRAKYAAWGITCAVLIAIVIVRRLPQPWRGLIDAGVVVGLSLGTLSLLVQALRRLLGETPQGNPDLPQPLKSA